MSDEELLSRLKILLEHQGKVSGLLIDEVEGMPSDRRQLFLPVGDNYLCRSGPG